MSYKTLPSYFKKEEIQEEKINARYDLEILARYIAPGLGISKRFVGEEPLDGVARQYNEQMNEILTLFGIKFEIVPRLMLNNKIVSALIVRAYMNEKN